MIFIYLFSMITGEQCTEVSRHFGVKYEHKLIRAICFHWHCHVDYMSASYSHATSSAHVVTIAMRVVLTLGDTRTLPLLCMLLYR